jgi:hypothetical protein
MLQLEVKSEENSKRQKAYAKLVFRPNIFQRLLGKRDVIMRKELSGTILKDGRVSKLNQK